MKKIRTSSKLAVSTTAIVAIVIVIVIVAAVGAYIALGTGTSTITTTQSTTVQSSTTVYSTTTADSSTNAASSGSSQNTAVSSSSSSSSTHQASTATTSTSQTFSYPASLPSVTLSEAGSSLVYPVFELWAPGFQNMYSNVQVNTAAGGSGSGQSGAEQGTLQLGASDAYLTNAQQAQYPYILNIPLAISAQQVNYNIPGLPASMHLNLTGPILAGIYSGTIAYWDNSAITSINPGATQYLTHHAIIPIRRFDASGDTFLFTSYLSASTPSWNNTVGFATNVNWPSNPALLSASGNSLMVTKCEQNAYSLAYIGVSYLNSTLHQSTPLGYAYLQNKAGNFVNISIPNIQAAAAAMVPLTPPDERISMIYAPGANSYPIINYEYVMVAQNQTTPGMAQTLRTLLTWIIDPQHGNSATYLDAVSFIPLPPSTVQLNMVQINKITGP